MKNKYFKKTKIVFCRTRSKNRLFFLLFTGAIVAILILAPPKIAYTFSDLPKANSREMVAQRLSNSKSDVSQIKKIVVEKMLGGAGSRVTPQVKRVIIVSNYALADWLLGESGGSAVLAKKKGSWVFLAPGGGVYNAEELQRQFKIPENTAKKLVQSRLQCIKYPSKCGSR